MGGEAQAIVKDRPLLPAERPLSTLVREQNRVSVRRRSQTCILSSWSPRTCVDTGGLSPSFTRLPPFV